MRARRPEAAISVLDVALWLERLLFEGAPEPRDGLLAPDPARPGLGLELEEREWKKFEAAV